MLQILFLEGHQELHVGSPQTIISAFIKGKSAEVNNKLYHYDSLSLNTKELKIYMKPA
jgi:hypothetical protein